MEDLAKILKELKNGHAEINSEILTNFLGPGIIQLILYPLSNEAKSASRYGNISPSSRTVEVRWMMRRACAWSCADSFGLDARARTMVGMSVIVIIAGFFVFAADAATFPQSVDCQSMPQSSYKFCDPKLTPEERATDLVRWDSCATVQDCRRTQ